MLKLVTRFTFGIMVSAIVCAGLNSPSYSFENHKYQKYAFSSSSPLLQDIYDNLYSSPNPYSFNLFFATSVISSLYQADVDYVLFREEGIPSFLELLHDTKKYIVDGCSDASYVEKYKKLGDSTGFFFKKTIYRVKK